MSIYILYGRTIYVYTHGVRTTKKCPKIDDFWTTFGHLLDTFWWYLSILAEPQYAVILHYRIVYDVAKVATLAVPGNTRKSHEKTRFFPGSHMYL